MMNLQPRTPLRKRNSLHCQTSRILESDKSINQPSHINQLYSKFMTISKDITIDHDISNFNMAQFQSNSKKIQHDSTMMQAKLKRLENMSELKRANMELDQRRKKSPKHTNPALLGKNQESYLQTFKNIMKNPSKKLFEPKSDTQSDDENKRVGIEQQFVSGVTHYNQLKKRPNFLKYTLEKMKQKNFKTIERQQNKTETLSTMRSQIKTIHHQNQNSVTARAKLLQKQSNPEEIADNIFRKIYTKKNKDISFEEARTEERIGKIMDKQNSILETIDGRSLSKENHKNLKMRLGQIINELYHDEKRHHKAINFPKIQINNTSKISNNDE